MLDRRFGTTYGEGVDLPIGRRIANWLEVLELPQAELARRVGVTPPSVSEWLSGRTTPRTEHLVAVASALGLTMTEFFGPIESPSPTAA